MEKKLQRFFIIVTDPGMYEYARSVDALSKKEAEEKFIQEEFPLYYKMGIKELEDIPNENYEWTYKIYNTEETYSEYQKPDEE